VVRLFIETFHRACVDDAETEHEVEKQLGALREAADNPDTEALRNTVRECVAHLEEAGRVRREREKKRLLALSDRVDKVSEELAAAREQMATDALTGVYNRAGFDEQVSLIVQLGAIAAPAAFLFMIDVDHFKWVNDRYGHPAGDAVLASVARALTKTFRRKADFLARFGGDEFAAVILEADANAARAIGERMLFAAREVSVTHEGEEIRVGISVGAAPQRVGEDAAAWIERADRALYRAKEKGRDCLVVVS
ncbi:MAG: GGDEF domain-containing protein, partial [Myxococcales bacterium]|nr:GGDEF domain-containing protein [Myxococcales bacterium]